MNTIKKAPIVTTKVEKYEFKELNDDFLIKNKKYNRVNIDDENMYLYIEDKNGHKSIFCLKDYKIIRIGTKKEAIDMLLD